jgi:hypothetical protein
MERSVTVLRALTEEDTPYGRENAGRMEPESCLVWVVRLGRGRLGQFG